MKNRAWLSSLVPPALLALAFGWQALFIDPAEGSMVWFVRAQRVFPALVGVGALAGLVPLLSAWAAGAKGFHVNGGTLLAGALTVAGAGILSPRSFGLTADSFVWVFTAVSPATTVFGGALLTGSLAVQPGGGAFSFRWRQAGRLSLVALGLYAVGGAMNLIHHIVPHSFSFDNFPPHPGPGFLTILMVQGGLAMALTAAAPLALPLLRPAGGVSAAMKVWGVGFSTAAFLVLAGYAVLMLENIAVAPHFGVIPHSVFTLPYQAMHHFSPGPMDGTFAMAGVMMRLGFAPPDVNLPSPTK